MACILNIETSTDVCSVAIADNLHVIWNEECFEGASHAVKLGVFVDQALSYIRHDGLTLDAVAVSSGPGSYTGLRIGVSTAKGVCFGSDVPLISVPTLQVLCVPLLLREEIEDDALLCPMIDARRMEVYSEIYDRRLQSVRPSQADIVESDTYKDYLDLHKVYFFGNGAEKCKRVITHPNARFVDNVVPLAQYMHPLSDRKYFDGEFADVAYFTPFYLKEFQATKPRKML